MQSPMRVLMEGLFDYAGLFPPAKLPLDVAARNFVQFEKGPEHWLVNRFVCPAAQLRDLASQIETLKPRTPFMLSVLGTGGYDLDTFEHALENDAKAMTEFETAMGDAAPIEGFEVRFPAGADVATVVRDLKAFDSVDVFLEIPWTENQENTLGAVAEHDWLGAKARLGGADPSAVPSSNQVASFLAQCLDLDVRFKLTAGLHEPFRHFDPLVGGEVHGFLNIATACLLHDSVGTSISEMTEVLDSSDAGAFGCTDSHLIWGEASFSTSAIRDLRNVWMGIGSCSIDEPIQGLQNLGLMDVNV